MKSIQNGAAYIFIGAVIILTGVSILGVWDFFSTDVIHKSVETLGLLAIISIIVMIASSFMDRGATDVAEIPDPTFKELRQITLIVLIIAVSILALLGVLAIWNVFTDHTILFKSLGSVAILAFSSFIVVLTCLDRENNSMLHKKSLNSAGPLIGIFFLMAFVFFVSLFFY